MQVLPACGTFALPTLCLPSAFDFSFSNKISSSILKIINESFSGPLENPGREIIYNWKRDEIVCFCSYQEAFSIDINPPSKVVYHLIAALCIW